jgi:hypothetical protein
VIDHIEWLPPIVTLADCGGSWEDYLESQYQRFRTDLIHSKPTVFHPRNWALKRHPVSQGKEATFWHVTSEGKTEENRTPDMRRMERVGWIRPMIDAYNDPERVCCWPTQRKGESRPNLAVPDFSYVLVLEEHPTYVMLWTAFHIEHKYQREKFRRQWETNRLDGG